MADRNSKLSRELDTRETDERRKKWQPAQLLPEPEREPGYGYRWVRISTLNAADARNISSKRREGWEPVKTEEQPQMVGLTDTNGKDFPGCIEIGGLILCKMPEEMLEDRRKYYADKNRQQVEAVDNNLMRENDPRMPLFKESKSTKSFGTGN